MLTSVTITNFKSYKEATINFAPLTLMIGANASGKSNAVEALKVLTLLGKTDASQSLRLEITDNCGIRSIKKSVICKDKDQFCGINCIFDCSKNDTFDILLHYVKPNCLEWLGDIFKLKSILPILDILTKKDLKNISHIVNNKFSMEQFKIIDKNLRNIYFLDTIPQKMRYYAQKENNTLNPDASNLSAVLYTLCQEPETKTKLLNFVKSLPEQDISDIHFIETPRDEVMLQLVETFGNKENTMDADSLSDGTLRVLAVGAFLLSAPAESLLVIEELDNGIHPSRAKMLVDQMLTLAEERHLQILLTSHNPALLDALPCKCLPNVLCCYRDKEEGDSRITRLGDMRKYTELVAQGSLGELVTRQILDRYLHDTSTEEEDIEKALAWLADLNADVEG